MHSEVPETIRLKEIELNAEQRRVDNFVAYIAEGRSSEAIGRAMEAAEGRVKQLSADLSILKASCDRIFKTPPLEWIEERVTTLQEILERRAGKSALILRKLLGKIHLEPVKPDIGKPYLRAVSTLQTLALIEINPGSIGKEPGISYEPELGSNSLQWWTLSQRIRTLAEMPFLVDLLEIEEPPVYQQIAEKSLQLHKLGLHNVAIALHLGVDGKTVAKALRWMMAKY